MLTTCTSARRTPKVCAFCGRSMNFGTLIQWAILSILTRSTLIFLHWVFKYWTFWTKALNTGTGQVQSRFTGQMHVFVPLSSSESRQRGREVFSGSIQYPNRSKLNNLNTLNTFLYYAQLGRERYRFPSPKISERIWDKMGRFRPSIQPRSHSLPRSLFHMRSHNDVRSRLATRSL